VLRRRREEHRLPYFSKPFHIDNGAETDLSGSGITLLGGPYQPAYYGGAGNQPGVWGPVSSKDYDLYIKNLHDAGYNPKNNYNANGTIKVQ